MPKYDWGFASEPEPHLGGRRLATSRGKVLGGSSSINGTGWVRGNPLDFDGWEAQGASASPAEPRASMSHPDDWTAMRAAVRLTHEIFAQAAFATAGGRSARR